MPHPFDRLFQPATQQAALPAKITAGLERLSAAFRHLLWQQATALGLSPIQIQVLIFVMHHPPPSVSELAREFHLTKATISDAVRVLVQKELLEKQPSPTDRRSFRLLLAAKGQHLATQTETFAAPFAQQVARLPEAQQDALWQALNQLIYQLNQVGIIAVQRTCRACSYYESRPSGAYCKLLGQPLAESDLRLDCPEFQQR